MSPNFTSLKVFERLFQQGEVLVGPSLDTVKLFEGSLKALLRGNPLHSLGLFTFPALPHLRLLDISCSSLTQLNGNTFKRLKFLEVLNLKVKLVETLR